MKRTVSAAVIIVALAFVILLYVYQTRSPERVVVVYTSVDQPFSEPILEQFEKTTGIRVLPVYDVEAAKTTGLVNRIIAEKNHPQADVFWSAEFVQTMLLKQEGALAAYLSPAAGELPSKYVDSEGYWTGFGGRVRVLLVNTQLVSPVSYPNSIFDLLSPSYQGESIGISNPLFGTTLTQAAALYAAIGPERAKAFYVELKSRGVRVVNGISVVRDQVAAGQLKIGFVDTDDGCVALRNGSPVKMIFPDQNSNGLGTLIIPNTVALIANSPHPSEGRSLIDYLVSRQVEEQLIQDGWFQIPLRKSNAHSTCPGIVSDVRDMNVTFTDVFNQLQRATRELDEAFIR